MILDASDMVLGRLASFVAKQTLLGETVEIVNCEKAVIIGRKENILAKYKQYRARGDPLYGPHFPRDPHRLVKRTIRGMLPYNTNRGVEAWKRVKCYKGVPARFEGKEIIAIERAKVSPNKTKFMTVQKISELL